MIAREAIDALVGAVRRAVGVDLAPGLADGVAAATTTPRPAPGRVALTDRLRGGAGARPARRGAAAPDAAANDAFDELDRALGWLRGAATAGGGAPAGGAERAVRLRARGRTRPALVRARPDGADTFVRWLDDAPARGDEIAVDGDHRVVDADGAPSAAVARWVDDADYAADGALLFHRAPA